MATSRTFASSDSLAVLTDAVNQTLIDTGRFFKSSGALQTRSQLKSSIPISYQRFQTALDTLSEQIFIAKAFLEKDYENITARKTAPKPEAESLPAPVPIPTQALSSAPSPAHAPAQQPPEDIPMSEAPDLAVGVEAKDFNENSELPDRPIKIEPTTAPQTMQLKQQNDAQSENLPTIEPIGAVKTDETTDKGDQPLSLTTGDEMNFDSMLAATGEATNAFDLNFNFTNDEIGDQNFLAGTDFGNTNSGIAGETNNDHGTSSISSLLPGLESYATDNNAGDNFNFDLPKLGDQPLNSLNVSGFDGSNDQDDLMGPGESSFDDLFMEKDNLEGEDSLLGGNLMDIGELDDSWLN